MTRASGQTGIGNYGLIGDSRAAALVSRRGSIDWCCLPRFDSPSCFAALLDPESGGRFSIGPAVPFRSRQDYVEDTNILETQFRTRHGKARLLDLFTVSTEETRRRMPWPDHEILRILEVTEGVMPMRVRYEPRTNYGRRGVSFRRLGGWGLLCEMGQERLVLQSSVNASRYWIRSKGSGEEAVAELVLSAGERAIFSLTHAAAAPAVIPPLGGSALLRYEESARYWRHWIGRCAYRGFRADQVRRSAFALKLLTYAPSGAIVAAPTSSLPERLGGVRNWDYRFCWLRDASFTVRALVSLGYVDEAKAYVSWLLHATKLTRPRLQVVYSVFGRTDLTERELPWLRGYAGSRPVRAGNAASGQLQLDVYGEVIEAFRRVIPYLDPVDKESRDLLLGMGRVVCDLWDVPDDGIWELREERAHHTHSKLMCWVALNRLRAMGRKLGWRIPARFGEQELRVRAAIERKGYSEPIGAYTRAFGEEELDASLLIMPSVGYGDARAPRIRSTIDAIAAGLTRNGLVYRYRPGRDGIEGLEGSFGICNFWLAEALTLAGRIDEALEWFGALAGRGNGTGLFSEEMDPDDGEFLGNYPQAFTHVGLINSALLLDRSLRSREARVA